MACLLASSFYDVPIEAVRLGDVKGLVKKPAALPALQLNGSTQLFGGHSICRYLFLHNGGASSSGVHDWDLLFEWHETILAPLIKALAANPQDATVKEAFTAAINALPPVTTHRPFLVGESVTLADLVVVASIFWATSVGALALEDPALEPLKPLLQLIMSDPKFATAAATFLKLGPLPKPPKRPRLPERKRRNVLITSALPYVNNVPHLGNIIGCVLSADVFSRYCRLRGYNSVYICGTDEYGTATETKAQAEGVSPREICDKYHAIHRDIYKWFDIGFDQFGRTSAPKQTQVAQDIFLKLYNKGFLQENTMEQLFCDGVCKRFLADRLAEGTCPLCGYEDARGDQCDKCGKLLNPTELKNPRCKTCGVPPMIKSTQHLFLDLPTISSSLEPWIAQSSVDGFWSSNSLQMTKAWIRDGLKPRCITRDLKWGIPVPLEKFKDKVLYVWFDAPIGYVSITAAYTDSWESWWKNPQNVELFQFMGKDNVPFHTVIFPSMLLGTGEPWTLLHHISTTEYLNYEAGKFSKSRGIGVFGDDAQTTGIPCEVWRYYLLVNRPEQSDTEFTWSDFASKNNTELLNNLGNLVNRSLSFIVSRFDSKIPPIDQTKFGPREEELIQQVKLHVTLYIEDLEKVKIKQALQTVMSLSRHGNAYLQDRKPWVLYKEDPALCGTVIALCACLVRLLAVLSFPYMPAFSRKVFAQLNVASGELTDEDEVPLDPAVVFFEELPAGHTIGKVAPIFRQITEDEVKALREKFAGRSH